MSQSGFVAKALNAPSRSPGAEGSPHRIRWASVGKSNSTNSSSPSSFPAIARTDSSSLVSNCRARMLNAFSVRWHTRSEFHQKANRQTQRSGRRSTKTEIPLSILRPKIQAGPNRTEAGQLSRRRKELCCASSTNRPPSCFANECDQWLLSANRTGLNLLRLLMKLGTSMPPH